MQWLNSHIHLNSLIWLFIAAFMIHDFEEIIFIESWTSKHYEAVYLLLPKPLRRGFRLFRNIKSSQFSVAVALEFIVFVPVTLLAADFHHFLFFIGFNAILLIHVLTHLGQSIFFKMYTPGVITALFVTLPYSVYLFFRLYEAGILDWTLLNHSLDIGIFLLPLILFGHTVGRKLIPNE